MNYRYLLVLLFLTVCQLASAQFAKIIDKDGYVNVRQQATVNSVVVSKIAADEIVYAFPDEKFGDWVIVDYTDNHNKSITGYVHNSRIKYIPFRFDFTLFEYSVGFASVNVDRYKKDYYYTMPPMLK
ncbi:hypothetical protein D3C81_1218640 [compost metagenome]